MQGNHMLSRHLPTTGLAAANTGKFKVNGGSTQSTKRSAPGIRPKQSFGDRQSLLRHTPKQAAEPDSAQCLLKRPWRKACEESRPPATAQRSRCDLIFQRRRWYYNDGDGTISRGDNRPMRFILPG